MDIGTNSSSQNPGYTSLWNKYRPVILKLMIDADNGPQRYQLFVHEFKSLNPKEKGGYTFTLQAHLNRAVNNIKKSVPAQDLLVVLAGSKKASELMTDATYEFTLDKTFTLSVARMEG